MLVFASSLACLSEIFISQFRTTDFKGPGGISKGRLNMQAARWTRKTHWADDSNSISRPYALGHPAERGKSFRRRAENVREATRILNDGVAIDLGPKCMPITLSAFKPALYPKGNHLRISFNNGQVLSRLIYLMSRIPE